jgi:hypothetical protein
MLLGLFVGTVCGLKREARPYSKLCPAAGMTAKAYTIITGKDNAVNKYTPLFLKSNGKARIITSSGRIGEHGVTATAPAFRLCMPCRGGANTKNLKAKLRIYHRNYIFC